MHLMWFRSDLRIIDNEALAQACRDQNNTVHAVFVVCLQQWLAHDWGKNKIGFVLKNLLALQEQLASINIHLEILYCDMFNQVASKLLEYAKKHQCEALYFNKEYELNEMIRDRAVTQVLNANSIMVDTFDEQCILPPGMLLNKQNKPYMVFTAFKKAAYLLIERENIHVLHAPKKRDAVLPPKCELTHKLSKYLQNDILDSWAAGTLAAAKTLHKFCKEDLLKYKDQRDYPALDATSKLSAYLAVGAISIKQCFIAARHANDNIFPGNSVQIMCWIDELLWRDFYRCVIVHNPDICKGENFNKKYDGLEWNLSDTDFNAWAKGQTGIPIIDAAMRQLVQTGWMHNRLRMIVAMFLTKQLLIDWRRGEKFFAEHLVDLDFASNNGGWQWCASTGTDAVPYFRIFNPVTQSERFDAHGDFIRKYCPEVAALDNTQIHNPSAYCDDATLRKMGYPRIMVDLKAARSRALAWFKG